MKIGDKVSPRVPIVETGTYISVCVGVLFIGEQYKEYKDSKGYENQVTFVWELPTELDADGKAKQLSKDLRVTLSEKGNLVKILNAWNGKTYKEEELMEIDLLDQLGKACQLVVSVSENGFSNVDSVTGFPKGIPSPTTNTALISFDVDAWEDAVFENLPEWVQNKIKKSTQYKKLHTPTNTVDFKEQPATAAPAAAKECPI